MIAKYDDPYSPMMPPLIRRKNYMDKASLGDKLPRVMFDGFKVDEKGLIWTSAMEGLAIINPLKNTYLARVYFGVGISNIEFGDGDDVYITGGGYLFRMKRNLLK